MTSYPIQVPGPFVPAMAMTFAASDGSSVLASSASPLPVAVVSGGSGGGSGQTIVDANGVYWVASLSGGTLTYVKLSNGTTGTPAQPVTPVGASVTLAHLGAQGWGFASPLDCTGYAGLWLQVDGISGTDTVTLAASLASGGTTYPRLAFDGAGNAYAAISAPGIYHVDGRAILTATHNGTASSPVLTVLANQ